MRFMCEKNFRQDSKVAAFEMFNGIRNEFEIFLNEVTWMDEKTRKSAMNKLKAMSGYTGYPDELMNISKIEKYYENLKIDPNNYLLSVLNLNKFHTDHFFSKLREPVQN